MCSRQYARVFTYPRNLFDRNAVEGLLSDIARTLIEKRISFFEAREETTSIDVGFWERSSQDLPRLSSRSDEDTFPRGKVQWFLPIDRLNKSGAKNRR
jgi:hypothetical protein